MRNDNTKRYVGHLATEEEIQNSSTNKYKFMGPIDFDHNGNWKIQIKVDSIDYPYDTKIIVAILDHTIIDQIKEKCNYRWSSVEILNKDLIETELNDLLISFIVNHDSSGIIATRLGLLEVEDYFLTDEFDHQLVPIYITPIIKKAITFKNTIRFKFLNNEPFGSKSKFLRQEVIGEDELLLGFKEENSLFLFGPINEYKKNIDNDLFPIIKNIDDLRFISLKEESIPYIIYEDIAFIDKKDYLRLKNLISPIESSKSEKNSKELSSKLIESKYNQKKSEVIERNAIKVGFKEGSETRKENNSENFNKITKEKRDKEFLKESQDSRYIDKTIKNINEEKVKDNISLEIIDKNIDQELKTIEALSEKNIINGIINTANERNLFFNKKEIINLHTAIKTNDFTVISGKSGVGKTELAKIYLNELNCKSIIIPVKASFKDTKDLIGYYDFDSNVYVEDENNLINFLAKAEKDQNNLYFVILDDMDLANVDNYFSIFLDLLNSEDKAIKLFSENYSPFNKINSKIYLRNNLKFIGVINLDRNNKNYSNRVLDKTNIIKLTTPNFTQKSTIINKLPHINHRWSPKEFADLVKVGETSPKLRELLFNLNSILIDKGLEFSPRVVNEIELYLGNLLEDYSIKEALDEQIVQRVLPKLRGSKKLLEDLIPLLIEYFNKYKPALEFDKTISELNQKMRNLENFGFTI